MELRTVIAAARRWRVLVVLGALGCAVVGGLLASSSDPLYRSTARLLIQAPASSVGGNQNFADPDRYVLGQVDVLRSDALASAVIRQMGLKATTREFFRNVRVARVPKTDLIEVNATDSDEKVARDIANTFVTLYLADQVKRLEAVQDPEVTLIDDRLATIGADLRAAENKVFDNPSDAGARIDRDALLTQYTELVRAKTASEFTTRAHVNSQIVELSTLAQRIGDRSVPVFAVLGGIVGLLAGVAGAVALTWLSPMIIDESQVTDITGQVSAAEIVKMRRFPRPVEMLEARPRQFNAAMKSLAIRAENAVSVSDTLVVAVVSSRRHSGTTSVAVGMAAYFAKYGVRVALVDANEAHPEVSESFGVSGGQRLATAVATLRGGGAKAARDAAASMLSSTSVPGLDVLGGGAELINRSTVGDVVRLLRGVAGVVVIDCAPMFESAATAQICELADVVSLVVPMRHHRVAALEATVHQLGSRPVVTVLSHIPAAS